MILICGVGLPHWIIGGRAMIIASMALDMTLLRRIGEELSERVTTGRDDPRIGYLQRRLRSFHSQPIAAVLHLG